MSTIYTTSAAIYSSSTPIPCGKHDKDKRQPDVPVCDFLLLLRLIFSLPTHKKKLHQLQ